MRWLEECPIEQRKMLLSGLKFRASESRDSRRLRQRAISQRCARKGPTNTGMIQHPLRGGRRCLRVSRGNTGWHSCCGDWDAKCPDGKTENPPKTKCREYRGSKVPRVKSTESYCPELSKLTEDTSVRRAYLCAATDCPLPGGPWVVSLEFWKPGIISGPRTWHVEISCPVVWSARQGIFCAFRKLESSSSVHSRVNACRLFIVNFLRLCATCNCVFQTVWGSILGFISPRATSDCVRFCRQRRCRVGRTLRVTLIESLRDWNTNLRTRNYNFY